MPGQSPLRRWKPFLAAFGLVDAAIEAAGPALCRDEVRSARNDVVEKLCGVPARNDDGGKAEKLCRLLDGFMAESLLTLQEVPRVLASSSADLTEAVRALRCHQSERIRRLASDVLRGWSVAVVEEDIARMKELQGVRLRVKVADERPLRCKKTPPSEEEEKMEATKRKLREGYREAEVAKRQRKIQMIEPPKKLKQRQPKKTHPILRERSQARRAVVRRCSVPSFNRR
jgi:hypothetical protein